jgi:type IV secretory pathway TraG/TraD family ATPase VirD4
MFYWLFTEGKALLDGCLAPLLCLSIVAPLVVAALLGAGIQRTGEEAPRKDRRRVYILAVHIIVNLGVTALYVTLLGSFAITRQTGRPTTNGLILLLTGAPPNVNATRLLIVGLLLVCLWFVVSIGLHQALRGGGWLRERIDRLRRPPVRRGAMGSSHFCTFREYRRYRRQDSDGVSLLGAFWGEGRRRLDFGFGRFCLNGEDAARGILTLGGAGSGKTQGVILPIIADRMLAGHSLIIADPQGEITGHVLRFAQATHHLVVIHDPTSAVGPRYNLAEDITNVSDARAIADVLIPPGHGDNKFWTDSAAALLAACLIRFETLGAIYNALNDLKKLAETLAAGKDDASLLANSFIASVGADGKVASNVVATLATALTGWAATDVRANTAASDFDADLIVSQPTVVVLTCPGRMRAVYASYLGATLRKLMLDLDTLGERNGGPLPMPVGIILDEFPTLGKLDGLVADVNLVRKRRMSILLAAQTKGQFHLIYGDEGTQALFTGLATQIVYGGCDHQTAKFYSDASGTATENANPDPHKANFRQRALLTVDEVVTPLMGNCTIFARYVEPAYATQVILTARLTRLYEREDWRARFEECQHKAPLLLERGVGAISVPLIMPEAQTAPQSTAGLTFDQVAQHMMDQVQAMDRRVGGQPTRFTNLQAMRRRQRALKVKQEVEFHVSGQEQDRG